MGTATIVVLAVIGVLLLAVIVLYNRLVRARIKVRQAWAQVDAQLQRRHDLIPNLVATVQGYAGHERAALDEVIAARATALSIADPVSREAAEDALGASLSRLLAVSEAYPDLKANQSFLQLQEELTGTEGRIAYARQFYNDTVYKYNTKIQSFPAVILANMFRFSEREYFEADDESRGPVNVSF